MITSGMFDTNDISVKMYMRLISDLNTYKEDLKYFNETCIKYIRKQKCYTL